MRAKTGTEREEIIVEQLNQGKVEKTGTHIRIWEWPSKEKEIWYTRNWGKTKKICLEINAMQAKRQIEIEKVG